MSRLRQPVAAGQGQVAGRRGWVVVDQYRDREQASAVAGEVGRAAGQRVRPVAEARCLDRHLVGRPGRAGLHPGRLPAAVDHRLGAGILGQAHASAVEQRFAVADPTADVGIPVVDALRTTAPATGGEIRAGCPRHGRIAIEDGDVQRPHGRPRVGFDRAPLVLCAGAEQAVLQGGLWNREVKGEVTWGRIGPARRWPSGRSHRSSCRRRSAAPYRRAACATRFR